MPRTSCYSIRMRASLKGKHISGAEGLYKEEDIGRIASGYSSRAMAHDKGRPDEVHITIERIDEAPLEISSLPLCTLKSLNPVSSGNAAKNILSESGISLKAVNAAFKLLTGGEDNPGAFLIDTYGRRIMKGMKNIRASRMGITGRAGSNLARRLGRLGINNTTVKEALILASKVQNHPGIKGELCISDDPSYTTGYAATSDLGYIRLPHIKERGVKQGGRVFFVDSEDIDELIEYMRNRPVIINRIAPCRGIVSISDVLMFKPLA